MLEGNKEQESKKQFPDWDSLYNNQRVETMPWFNEKLDDDIKKELKERNIKEGSFLDLGTGPATQAFQLAKIGFEVTGSDISEAAINRARELYEGRDDSLRLRFIVDDILNSKIRDNEFDYIFDRGCFHVLSIDKRLKYVIEVNRLLKYTGLLFLKCFSKKEPREEGPYKFSEDEIRDLFERESFEIDGVEETVYQGTLDPLPKALFVVMKKI
jgi:SAM-dependent methyltransferase